MPKLVCCTDCVFWLYMSPQSIGGLLMGCESQPEQQQCLTVTQGLGPPPLDVTGIM